MKIETHLHTSCGSGCGEVAPELIPQFYIDRGFDALIVTEHYSSVICDWYAANNKKSLTESNVDAFFHGYRRMVKAAQNTPLRIFFGMEIGIVSDFGFAEFMLYGFDEKFLYAHPDLYLLDQRKLYSLCADNGFFLYQTHPFRVGINRGDTRYLDGIEVYNGHPGHDSHNDLAEKYCAEHNLIPLSGSDCHFKAAAARGGIYLENDVESMAEIISNIRQNKHKLIIDGEIRQ